MSLFFCNRKTNTLERTLPADSPESWKQLPIRYTVRSVTGEQHYIVFIDHACDLDWMSNFPVTTAKESVSGISFSGVLNAAALLEITVKSWNYDLKLLVKRTIGESIASALEGDLSGAKDALSKARELIEKKKLEVSKSWIFECSLRLSVSLFVVSVIVSSLSWMYLDGAFSDFWKVPIVFGIGCIGALCSILFNLKKMNFDSMSEKRLHADEAYSRILVGGIAGLLSLLMMDVGLLGTNFQNSPSAIFLMAFVFGGSERLLPGIIEKIRPNT
jgi:hypothetical protein